MKSLDAYKNAVMQRVHDKRVARQKARRRIAAFCIPLCLTLGVVGTMALRPLWSVSTDMNSGASPETLDDLRATIECVDTTIVVDDATALYEAVLGLYDAVGGTNGSTRDELSFIAPENGSDAELGDSYYEDAEEPSVSSPYYLHFIDADGIHSFLLQNGTLTDLTSGVCVSVTDDQAYALMNGVVPNEN